jgi:hypothetical protein
MDDAGDGQAGDESDPDDDHAHDAAPQLRVHERRL